MAANSDGRGKVVLVTGGMGGLGETIATKMVDAGYKVVVTYSPGNTKHKDWVADMKKNGYDILAVQCDVSDIDSCTRAVGEVQGKVGAIDILVNNAGITRDMTFKKMDKVNWDAVMRTNLDSLFNMTKQVADGMVERTGAGSSTSRRSTAARARSARPTTRRPRPACTASLRRSRSRSRRKASPSTRSRPATSARRW